MEFLFKHFDGTLLREDLYREEGLRLPVHLSSPPTNIVFLPTLHTDNLHFLARHAILPNKRLLKQAVKNLNKSQNTSRSGTSLEISQERQDQKGLMKGEDLTLTPNTFMSK